MGTRAARPDTAAEDVALGAALRAEEACATRWAPIDRGDTSDHPRRDGYRAAGSSGPPGSPLMPPKGCLAARIRAEATAAYLAHVTATVCTGYRYAPVHGAIGHVQRVRFTTAAAGFALLGTLHPGRYEATQLRTLQRQVATWRTQYGPGQEVIFPQTHLPDVDAQSDFTHMSALNITLGGVPFPHLVFHLVLSYSNVEAIQLCFSESFESLVEGIETCLWRLGGVPQRHRTDHLSAAIHPLDAAGRGLAKERYRALMRHYGMEPTTNTLGVAHENGDVEQVHRRCKEALDQALRVRGSRDFVDRTTYTQFLQTPVTQSCAPYAGGSRAAQYVVMPQRHLSSGTPHLHGGGRYD